MMYPASPALKAFLQRHTCTQQGTRQDTHRALLAVAVWAQCRPVTGGERTQISSPEQHQRCSDPPKTGSMHRPSLVHARQPHYIRLKKKWGQVGLVVIDTAVVVCTYLFPKRCKIPMALIESTSPVDDDTLKTSTQSTSGIDCRPETKRSASLVSSTGRWIPPRPFECRSAMVALAATR